MIDKTSVVDSSAQIAEDAFIGPSVVIGKDVKIGSGVKILGHAYLECCEIGEGTLISSFATIGTAPQDLGYKNEPTKVIVGKNCTIKENVTIHRAANAGDLTTRVGNKCLLMVGSHVAHNCVLEDEVILANLATLGGHVHVGKGAFIGGMSVFHQNVRIGEMSIVSGFSASRQDILPYSKCDGRPAVPVGTNVIALRRRGVEQQQRTEINRAFKLLTSPDYNTTQGIEEIRKTISEGSNKYVDTMIKFIQESKRGVVLNRIVKSAKNCI